MISGLPWGTDNKPVAMTTADAESLVSAIVTAITDKTRDGILENYRQMARLEAELAETRREATRTEADHTILVNRLNAEIGHLRAHIDRLNAMLASFVPNPNHFQESYAPVSAPVMYTVPTVVNTTIPMPPPAASWDQPASPTAG